MKLGWAISLLMCLVGCSGGNKFAGTYKATSGSELILSGDGTYRYLIGERTSAQDSFGTFSASGDSISFKSSTANPRFTEAKVTGDGFAIRTTDGRDWKFFKQ